MPFTADDLKRLGFWNHGGLGLTWQFGPWLCVTLYTDGAANVLVDNVPLYGVKTRADLESLIRLIGKPE